MRSGDPITRSARSCLHLVLCVLVAACTLHEPRPVGDPDAPIPDAFFRAEIAGEVAPGAWWRTFGEPELDAAVERALAENREIRQAWARLDQARAAAAAAGAALVPAIGLGAEASYTSTRDQDIGGSFGNFPIGGEGGGLDLGSGDFERSTLGYALAPRVSWEIDLWGKIAARRDAAALRVEVGEDELVATALLIAGRVVDAWFEAREQERLLRLLDRQETSSRELVELTELRFSNGQVGALDVLQQRQQVLAVAAERPLIRAALARAENELAVLTVTPVAEIAGRAAAEPAWTLPPFPALVAPRELIAARPDLRAARNRVRAADRDLAVALAERLPSLDLTATYRLSAARGPGLFDREALSVIAGLTAPLFEGGRLDAEAERARARVRESLDAFAQAYLVALREVEDALVDERRQVDLLALIERRLDVAADNLEQARRRYGNGLSSYLEVLAAIQDRQALERRLIVETGTLMSQRARLHRALGGADALPLEPPENARGGDA